MRTPADRIRHALSFEIIGLILVTPLGGLIFHQPFFAIGVIAVVSSLIAMVWNYVYNLGFDHLLHRFAGTTQKTLLQRVAHAILFELGLTVVLVPFFAWYLGIGLMQALMMDIALTLFYAAYAFLFNLAYDRLYPLPEWQEADGQ